MATPSLPCQPLIAAAFQAWGFPGAFCEQRFGICKALSFQGMEQNLHPHSTVHVLVCPKPWMQERQITPSLAAEGRAGAQGACTQLLISPVHSAALRTLAGTWHQHMAAAHGTATAASWSHVCWRGADGCHKELLVTSFFQPISCDGTISVFPRLDTRRGDSQSCPGRFGRELCPCCPHAGCLDHGGLGASPGLAA